MARASVKTGITIVAVDKATPILKRVGSSAKKMAGMAGKAFAVFGKAMTVFNQTAQLGALAMRAFHATFGAVLRAFRVGLEASMKYGTALREVSTLVDSAKVSTDSLNKSINQLAVEFGKSPIEQAKGLYMAISSGAQAGAQATQLMTVANKMAVGGVTSVDRSIDALTTVINAYGVSFYDADKVSDKFFQTIKLGKTTAGELASGIGMVATSAASSGISMNEMFTIIAAGTKVGLNTAKSTVGLNAAIAAIIKPSKDAQAEAKRLGIQWDAAALRSKGLVNMLKEVAGNTKLTDTTLTKLIPSIRAMRIATAVMNNGFKEVNMIMPEMTASLGSTDIAYKKMTESVDHQINIFGTLKTQVITAFGGMMKNSDGFRDNLMMVQEAFKDLLDYFNTQDAKTMAEKFWRSLATGMTIFLKGMKFAVDGARLLAKVIWKTGSEGFTELSKGLGEAIRRIENAKKGIILSDRATHEEIMRGRMKHEQTIVELQGRITDAEIDAMLVAEKAKTGSLNRTEKKELENAAKSLGLAQDLEEGKIKLLDVANKLRVNATKFTLSKVEALQLASAKGQENRLRRLQETDKVIDAKGNKRHFASVHLQRKLRIKIGAEIEATAQDRFDRERDRLTKVAADAKKAAASRKQALTGGTDDAVKANKKAAKAEFKADADAQTKVRKQAALLMESRMSGIEAMELEGAALKEKIEQHKLQVTKKFEDFKQGVAAKGVSDAVKNYQTIAQKEEELYKKNLELQMKTVQAAQEAYAIKLAAIDKSNMSETEKERAKELEKRKMFAATEEYKKSEISKGIQVAEKESRRLTAIARKTAAGEQKAAKAGLKEQEKLMKQRVQYAGQIGNAMFQLGRGFVNDLMDDEVSAQEALENLGTAAITMAAESFAQFLLVEGLKAAVRASSTTAIVAADAIETTSALAKETLVTGAAVVGTSKRTALKVGESSAGILSSAMGAAAGVWEFFASMGPIGWVAAAIASAAMIIGVLAYQNMLPGMAEGGLITGGIAGRDSVPAMLMPGEFVLNKGTVDSIRSGAPPTTPGQYAHGGMVLAGPAATGNVIFAPQIQTIHLPNSAQNQRYWRDTVTQTQRRLRSNGYTV